MDLEMKWPVQIEPIFFCLCPAASLKLFIDWEEIIGRNLDTLVIY
jgi:hypothetical protein